MAEDIKFGILILHPTDIHKLEGSFCNLLHIFFVGIDIRICLYMLRVTYWHLHMRPWFCQWMVSLIQIDLELFP